jgi:large subunit ribosomal protein L22
VATTETRQEVKAAAKWVRISPRKARLVVEHIRGRSVPEARTVLAFTPRAAAREVEKLLKSAVANAEANHDLIGDDLVVSAAYVDEGPMFKRWRPRARGRAARIRKRTCHITLKLAPVAEATVTRAAPAEEEKPKRAPRRRKAATPKAEAKTPKSEAEEKPAAKRPVRSAEGAADRGRGSRGNREVPPAEEKVSKPRRKPTRKKTEPKEESES